jgi:hypothetical protein
MITEKSSQPLEWVIVYVNSECRWYMEQNSLPVVEVMDEGLHSKINATVWIMG